MSDTSPWVDGLTIAQAVGQTARRFPTNDAVVFPQLGYRRSYAEFLTEAKEIARGLLSLGVERGDAIGIWSTNWPEWVMVQFAAAHAGAILVNINPAYRPRELEYVLNQADIRVLLLSDSFKTSNYFEILAEVCPEINTETKGQPLKTAKCPKLRHVVSIKNAKRPGMLNWQELKARAAEVTGEELEKRAAQLVPEDVVNIQYTSGTTGFPKGAMLTHRNLLLNAYYVGERMSFGPKDRLCIPVPLYHCFGCVMGTLMCSIYGACMVFPSEGFDALAALEAVQNERCTGIFGVPTMFIAELNHPRFAEFDLSSLRTGIMAGSPCPVEVMRGVVEKMGANEITIAYGLTEASPVITQTTKTDSLEHRVGTVGKPLPGLEVKIVKPGTLEPVARGEPGELMVRGHGVMKGYYNMPEQTAAAIEPDGWLHTGDIAVLTDDGYYRITGRSKDMIIRGGENIYPREIEEFLYTHPKIADVQVVGLPDENMGEELCAWVKPKPGANLTEEEVRDFCRGQIAHFKVPRYVVIVDSYPTTVTGKVQKFKLREMGIERFGLHKAAGIETA
ncbi:MAG: AMP-binding protein [Gemmatales bacterium]|nr:MAG: AMP-binding protein [Gemmatales bacterium]